MRDALILLVTCFWCYPKLLAQEPAGIAAAAVNTVTRAPLSRVHITRTMKSRDDGARTVYRAVSDDAGHRGFEDPVVVIGR
jgi:hypothetical protein